MSLSVVAHAQRNVAGRRLAVVVGVDRTHSSLFAPLSYANRDAQEIADVLQQCCEVELLVPPLLGEQATSAAVKRAVLDLARDRSEDDLLLFYFSGHGQQVYD